MEKDSLARKIYFNNTSEEEFLKNPFPLAITNNYVSFTTQKGGYNRLMQNLENLPEDYQFVLPLLNNLYVERQNDIDDYNEMIKNTVMITQRNYDNKNPKYADYILGILPREESLKFKFNDPFLKNRTGMYMNDLSNVSVSANDYKADAIKLYKRIDSILGSYSNTVKLQSLPIRDSILPFVGTYEEIGEAFGITDFKMTIEKDHLLVKSSIRDILLFWHQDNYFYEYGLSGSFQLYKNEKGQHIVIYSNQIYKVQFIQKR